MKTLAFLLLFAASCFSQGAKPLPYGASTLMLRDTMAASVIDTPIIYSKGIGSFTKLHQIITASGSNPVRFVVDKHLAIDSNLTFPATWEVDATRATLFTVASGKTLTIAGEIRAGPWQIFSGSGIVVFSGYKKPTAQFEWWGAARDGSTDDATAIQAAFTCAKNSSGLTILMGEGTYRTKSTDTIFDNTSLICKNPFSCVIANDSLEAFIATPNKTTPSLTQTSNLSAGDLTNSMTSPGSLAAGDVMWYQSTTRFTSPWDGGSALSGRNYNNGEILRVQGVSGTTITFETGSTLTFPKDSAASGYPVYFTPTQNVHIRGVKFSRQASAYSGFNRGLYIQYCVNCSFEDLEIGKTQSAGIEFQFCMNPFLKNIHTLGDSSTTQTNYGIAIAGGTKYLNAFGIYGRHHRHIITGAGATNIVSMYNAVDGFTSTQSVSFSDEVVDTHGCTLGYSYLNGNLDGGITIDGVGHQVTNVNCIQGRMDWGDGGFGSTFTNVTFNQMNEINASQIIFNMNFNNCNFNLYNYGRYSFGASSYGIHMNNTNIINLKFVNSSLANNSSADATINTTTTAYLNGFFMTKGSSFVGGRIEGFPCGVYLSDSSCVVRDATIANCAWDQGTTATNRMVFRLTKSSTFSQINNVKIIFNKANLTNTNENIFELQSGGSGTPVGIIINGATYGIGHSLNYGARCLSVTSDYGLKNAVRDINLTCGSTDNIDATDVQHLNSDSTIDWIGHKIEATGFQRIERLGTSGRTNNPRLEIVAREDSNQVKLNWEATVNPKWGLLALHDSTEIRFSDTASIFSGNIWAGNIVNAQTGYRIGAAAASGAFLRGNGTNFVSSNILASDATKILDSICSTRGSLLERGASAWVCITPGTSGYALTSSGAGADPAYTLIAGGVTGFATPAASSVKLSSPTAGAATTAPRSDATFQIDSANLSTVYTRLDSLAKWRGATTITTLGTIATGSIPNTLITGLGTSSTKNIADLAGTTNQISLSASGTGVLNTTNITLSLPQNIHTAATPQFTRLGLNQSADGTASLAFLQTALGVTSTDGIIANNSTAAAAGAPQWSPRLHWIGNGWNRSGTPATNAIDYIAEVQTYDSNNAIQAAANLYFSYQNGGGGYNKSLALDNQGNIGIGPLFTNATTNEQMNATLDIEENGGASVLVGRHSGNSSAPTFTFRKSRGTLASPTIVSTGDITGIVRGQPYHGTAYISTAEIDFVTNGTVTSGQRPQGDILFYTNVANGSQTNTATFSSTGYTFTLATAFNNKLSFTAIADPSTAGDFWYSTTQKDFASYVDGGIAKYLTGQIWTNGGVTKSYSNSSSEVSIWPTGIGTKTLPAACLLAGKTMDVYAAGNVSTTLTPTLTLKLKYGSTVIASTGAVTTGSGVSSVAWNCNVNVIDSSAGSSGKVWAQGACKIGAVDAPMVNTASSTVNTTTTQAVDFTAQFGSISVLDSLILTNSTMRLSQ